MEVLESTVTALDQLLNIYARPSERVLRKEIDHVDAAERAFIAASPFLVLAIESSQGLDCSPKGAKPGFVEVEDDGRIVDPRSARQQSHRQQQKADRGAARNSRVQSPPEGARSMRRGKPRERNAGRTRSPSAEQALRFFGSASLKIRFQQREFDQVMLRAAAANALGFGGKRGQHINRRRKMAALERREAA
jgi:hypothetical protein